MQCVVLAGGMATRMWPHTERTPKWLLPVAGRPFAHWQLEWLAANGVDEVVCCVGYLSDAIEREIGSGEPFGLHVEYSHDGPELRGTGGALVLAADRGLLRDQFVVVYGDSYLPVDVEAVWQAFLAGSRPALMTVFRNEGAFDSSNAAYADGQVIRYTKTDRPGPDGRAVEPPLTFIDYGLSVLRRDVLDGEPRDVSVDLASLFEALAAHGQLAGYEVHERFYEIGSPAGLADLERHLGDGG